MKPKTPLSLLGVTLAILLGSSLLGYFRTRSAARDQPAAPAAPPAFEAMRAAFERERRLHLVTLDERGQKVLELWIDGPRFLQETRDGTSGFDGARRWKKKADEDVAFIDADGGALPPFPADPLPVTLSLSSRRQTISGAPVPQYLRYEVALSGERAFVATAEVGSYTAVAAIEKDPETGLPVRETYEQRYPPAADLTKKLRLARSTTLRYGAFSPEPNFSPPGSAPTLDVGALREAWRAQVEPGNLGTIALPANSIRFRFVRVNERGDVFVVHSETNTDIPPPRLFVTDEGGRDYLSLGDYRPRDLKSVLALPDARLEIFTPAHPVFPQTAPEKLAIAAYRKPDSRGVSKPGEAVTLPATPCRSVPWTIPAAAYGEKVAAEVFYQTVEARLLWWTMPDSRLKPAELTALETQWKQVLARPMPAFKDTDYNLRRGRRQLDDIRQWHLEN